MSQSKSVETGMNRVHYIVRITHCGVGAREVVRAHPVDHSKTNVLTKRHSSETQLTAEVSKQEC